MVKPFKNQLSISMTLKVIGTMADLLIPWLIAYIIDTEIPNLIESGSSNYTSLYFFGGLMILIAFMGWIFNIYANRKAEWIASRAVMKLRSDLFHKIEHLSSTQINELTRVTLISRMTSDTYNLYSATASLQRIGIRAPVLLLGGIIMTFFLDPILTLIMILTLPFISLLVYYSSKKGAILYTKTQKAVDVLVRKVREFITGVRVVRALSANEKEINEFDSINQSLVQTELDAHQIMSKINPIMSLIMNIGLVLVLLAGSYRMFINKVDKGQIMAFVTYFTIILNAMMSITRVFVLLSRANASAKRIDEVLDLKEDNLDGDYPLVQSNHLPHIIFDHVSFSYHKNKDNIHDVSFTLERGQTLGIIGATGSGKTTLISLLMRFYKVDKGHIYIFGQDINQINPQSLRKSIGVVFQNDLIFSTSIKDNITFNRSVSEETLEEVTEIAQAHFIYEKDSDFDYQMAQKGINLSGGQKQRILIARALAGNPDLLILDDASSALDYETDMKLRSAINQKMPNVTKIIIAQRVSSLKSCHQILVLDEGEIVASGTHDSLMQTSPIYQLIAKHQLGGNLDE